MKNELKKVKEENKVVVIDIQMKFWSIVIFMVKWIIASIPAFIILMILIMFFTAMLTAITQVY